jgi:hypothetical protein
MKLKIKIPNINFHTYNYIKNFLFFPEKFLDNYKITGVKFVIKLFFVLFFVRYLSYLITIWVNPNYSMRLSILTQLLVDTIAYTSVFVFIGIIIIFLIYILLKLLKLKSDFFYSSFQIFSIITINFIIKKLVDFVMMFVVVLLERYQIKFVQPINIFLDSVSLYGSILVAYYVMLLVTKNKNLDNISQRKKYTIFVIVLIIHNVFLRT